MYKYMYVQMRYIIHVGYYGSFAISPAESRLDLLSESKNAAPRVPNIYNERVLKNN